eukprot:TRINITY_DN121338_c1_g1_i1.p1 TRINITY_DN121338_c1_g1~~TRINITY_DN121338_c1_g1_i1.p1  ORF type:complete len:404 (-),score=5.96 TRINITY_DN121338_c1_g1_i1:615-1697(-)
MKHSQRCCKSSTNKYKQSQLPSHGNLQLCVATIQLLQVVVLEVPSLQQPIGYVSSIRAAQKGLKTICIDKVGRPGGTCLHWGCIPSQALLRSTMHYVEAKKLFPKYGLKYKKIRYDFGQIMKRKTEVVYGLTKGIEALFCKYGVTYAKGTGRLLSPGRVEVHLNTGEREQIQAKDVIIATGSEPKELPNTPIKIDEHTILSSSGALALKTVPKSLIIIGAGAIGMELGCVYHGLGSEVTLVECSNRIVPFCDSEISDYMQKLFTNKGFKFFTEQNVVAGKVGDAGAKITIEDRKSGKRMELEAEKVLVAIGRKPFTKGLGLEKGGFQIDNFGRFLVNQNLEVSQGKKACIDQCEACVRNR